LAVFFRDLRRALGGEPLPYLWVPEWHKTHGLHAHFAMGRFVHWSLIERVWDRGFIKMKLLSDLPIGSLTREESRRAAGYLSKYMSKDFGSNIDGLHRYELAQGFQPTVLRLAGRSSSDVLNQACEVMGAQPKLTWSSAEAEHWVGPPAVWFQWA